jgi:hypothetical protein
MVKMTYNKINLTDFRKTFNIPADFIRSTCKILNIEINKVNKDQFISLENTYLNIENDIILLYAFEESKTTGKLDRTKQKAFKEETLDTYLKQVEEHRQNYIKAGNQEITLAKKPKDAIDISSTSIDVRREEFISMITEIVSKSVSNQNKSVLNTQQELQTAMEKNWLLTNEQLGTLLGMSKSTIGSKPDGWVRMGFRYSKIKEGTMTLWRVSQY